LLKAGQDYDQKKRMMRFEHKMKEKVDEEQAMKGGVKNISQILKDKK
jgi:hypothetical protein